jgi:cell division protein FtsB
MGELQLKLLQQIEELTLYNIQLMKDLEDLKKNQTELVEKMSNLNQ